MKVPNVFKSKLCEPSLRSGSKTSSQSSSSGTTPAANSRLTVSKSLSERPKRFHFVPKLVYSKSAPPQRARSKRSEVCGNSSLPSDEISFSSGKSSEHSAEIEELCTVFRIFDTNGDGKISISELGAVMNSLGDHPTEEDLRLMVEEADFDGDGFIDLDEFLRLNTDSARGKTKSEELKAAFGVFDMNNDGLISAEELYRVLSRLGEKGLTMDQCCRMIAGVDSNGDGFVSYEEFETMMRSL